MYTGKNPSALHSRDWLCTSLLQLLGTKKYEQITVKEICEKAGLSRQTFYQIFVSKDEIIGYYFSTLFEQFSKECDDLQHISISELGCIFFQFFYQHRDFVGKLLDSNMSYLLGQQFEIYLRQIPIFQAINHLKEHPDYSLAFVAGALTQTLTHWFRCEFDLSAAEVGHLTEHLLTGAAFHSEN